MILTRSLKFQPPTRYYGPIGRLNSACFKLQVSPYLYKYANAQFHKNTIKKYKYWKYSVVSDTFFLLANRSIDPNLRTIATSYIIHYDYKEARFFFHYLTQ